MVNKPITYSEQGDCRLNYFGVVYCKNGHTFYTKPFTNRSSARRYALKLNAIHG